MASEARSVRLKLYFHCYPRHLFPWQQFGKSLGSNSGAASCRQKLRNYRNISAAGTATPLADCRWNICSGQFGSCSILRLKQNNFTRSIWVNTISDGDFNQPICVGVDCGNIFARCRRTFAAPSVRGWSGGSSQCLVCLGNSGAARGCSQNHFRHFGALGVVLISRESHGSQNTDDRNHDHQFDQGKTLLHGTLHKFLLGVNCK